MSEEPDTVDIEKDIELKDDNKFTSLKIGHFQLNTSSFWITVICILCMFLLCHTCINLYMYNKIMTKFIEHEDSMLKTIVKPQQAQ